MEKVVLYAILSNGEILSNWIHPDCRKSRTGMLERVLKKVGSSSLLVRKTQCEEGWAYHFSQDEYLFVLAAAGPDVRPPRLSEN
jgi:hypothetical protein